MLHRLPHDLIKYFLVDGAVIKPALAVLAEGRVARDLVPKPKTQKPAVGNVYFDFLDQLALAANAEKVADKKHLEQDHRINRRTSIVRTI